MASTSSSSPDEIQLRKEVSSVQMVHVSIDAEMKKDPLEADIADSTSVMPEPHSFLFPELKARIRVDAEMETDPYGFKSEDKAESPLVLATNKNYVLYMAEKGGSSPELQSDSFIYEKPQKAEFYMERDLLEKLGTAEKGESSTLLQPNFINHDEYMPSCIDVNARIDKDQGIRESVIVDDSPSMMAANMNPELYEAVKGGNIAFIQEIARDMECSLLLETSPKLNSILHIAASSGHDELVKVILQTKGCQELVRKKNSTDNLALHVAASAGHLPIVKLLVSSNQQLEEFCHFEQLREQNKEGNTPLHVALINKYQNVDSKMKTKYNEVASYLVEMDPEVSYFQVNEENKSPLYMVAEAGDVELLKLMMNKLTRPLYVAGKAIVHAAIYGAFTTKNLEVLDTVLRKLPNLIKLQKDKGMTPLSYAASIGYLAGIQYLLRKSPDCAYESDQDGFFPVHTASRKGHTEVIKFFLEQYPVLSELLNREGQNILHVAVLSGKAEVVAYMLKRNDLEMLFNEKDKKGNTPLHLASKGRYPKVVSILTMDKRINLNSLNNEGKTALDISWNSSEKIPSFRERLTRQALRYAGAQRAPPGIVQKNLHSSELEEPHRVDTILLVATLVATVTFAAAFTMPGGYNSSGGMATFLEIHMFYVFVISNTIAMYSAITVVVALISAQLGDLNLVIAAFKFSVPILGLSLVMVSVSFMVGNYLVLRSLNWLSNLVLIIGSFFLLTLSILFFPLCLPSSLHNSTSRYILYYAFLLSTKVTRSDMNDGEEE